MTRDNHEKAHGAAVATLDAAMQALEAAEKERDELRQLADTYAQTFSEHCGKASRSEASLRAWLAAAERERDELRAKVDELREQLPEIDDLAFERGRVRGREDERRDVVAWMRRDADSCEMTACIKPGSAHAAAILRIAAKTIEEGDHEGECIERGDHVTAGGGKEPG